MGFPRQETYNFSEIYWTHDDGLADTESRNKTTSIDCTQAAAIAHENSDSHDPDQTQLASCPKTTDAITNQESTVQR